jgi:hypothetical protein
MSFIRPCLFLPLELNLPICRYSGDGVCVCVFVPSKVRLSAAYTYSTHEDDDIHPPPPSEGGILQCRCARTTCEDGPHLSPFSLSLRQPR